MVRVGLKVSVNKVTDNNEVTKVSYKNSRMYCKTVGTYDSIHFVETCLYIVY